MPEYSDEIKAKLEALRALPAEGRTPSEVVAVYWPSPDGAKYYAVSQYDELPGYEGLPVGPVVATLIPSKSSPFLDLPRSASVSDDGVDFEASDTDREWSRLIATHGEGVRVEVFGYWQPVDLFLSLWRGAMSAPKEMRRGKVKVAASTGFKSPQLVIPRRPRAVSCPFIWGGHLRSQPEIDYMRGCPFNAHLSDEERGDSPLVGIANDPSTGLPWADCSRRDVGVCLAHLGTKRFWPGFETRADPIPNNQTKGPNLMARAVGNDSVLNEPIRVIAGERLIKLPAPIKFRNEANTNHPDKGFGAAVFDIGEGPMDALWGFYINGVFVGSEHQNLRLGEGGQPPTFFSPNENSYSWTAHAFGRIQGNFNNAKAGDFTGSIRGRGMRDTRVYSAPNAYAEGYTVSRAFWLLRALCDPRWGYGNAYEKYNIDSVIDTDSWGAESVSMHDPNGTLFAGTRSTFNAELNGRVTQETIQNICAAGRIGIPYEFGGFDVFTPLRKETLDDSIPTFTDEGTEQNIIYEKGVSSLTWAPVSDKTLINQWTVNYDDASNGFADTQLVFNDQPQQLRAGRAYGDRSIKVVSKSQPAFGVTNFPEAARLGVYLLYLGLLDGGGIANPFEVKLRTWYAHAMNVQMHKPIRVLSTELQRQILLYFESRAASMPTSMPWFAGNAYQYFRVKKYERKGDLTVELTAQLYPEDFHEMIEDVEQPLPLVVAPPELNPGGRRDEQPERIGFATLSLSGDRIQGRLEQSVF